MFEGDGGANIGATISNTAGQSLVVQNRTGGTVNFTGTIDDDEDGTGGFSEGVLIAGNTDAVVNLSTNTQNIRVGNDGEAIAITGNTTTTVNGAATAAVNLTATGTGRGLVVSGNDSASAVTFSDLMATAADGNTVEVAGNGAVTLSSADDTRTIENTGTGNAFFNDGATGNDAITVNSNIVNTGPGPGAAVQILNRDEDNTIQFSGTVESTNGPGLVVSESNAGTVLFTQRMTLDTGGNDAVSLTNNNGAVMSFNGVDITTVDGNGFVASGGGQLLVGSPDGDNSINVSGSGIGLSLTDVTIDDGDVTFDFVDAGNGTGGNAGINLLNLTGDAANAGDGTVAIGGGTNAGDGGLLNTGGTAINVDNVSAVAITNVQVTNAAGAAGLVVTNQIAGSSATFDGLDINTDVADAVNIAGNDAGTVTFNGISATTIGAGDGIDIVEANGSAVAVTITDATVNANGTGRGFAHTGGGTVVMDGTNEINSAGATAFEVTNAENLTASNVTIANTAQQGVVVAGLDSNGDTVTLTNFDVTTTTADTVTVENNTDGTVNLTTFTAESTTGGTVVLANNTGAEVNVNGMTAESTGSGDVFSATGGGTLSASGTNNITAATGRGLNVENMTIAGTGAVFSDVTVTAGDSTGINLDTNTGGSVIVNGGTMTTDNTAIAVNDTESAAINGVDIENSTTDGAGIVVTNSAGDTFSMSNTDVETSVGAGVDVTGGSLTATGSNTVATTTGRGLDIDSTTIGAAGASFNSVEVTSGADNGVVLNNLTGGTVRVGTAVATGVAGTGGTLNTAEEAILVTGVANAVFNDVTTTTAGAFDGVQVTHTTNAASNVLFNNLTHTDSGTGNGVVVTDNGIGELDFTLRNSTLEVTAANSLGFNLVTGANTGEIDIELDGNTINAGSNSAVNADLSAGTGDVQFLVNGGNAWTNSSVADATANFIVNTDRTLNATIGDQTGDAPFDTNRFTNTNGGGTGFAMESNSAAATVNLDLRDNTGKWRRARLRVDRNAG